MRLYNNTSNDVFYGISAPGVGDCGNIAAGGTVDLPSYNNMQDVNVTFGAPLELTINNTETGKVVTVGIYQE